MYRAIAVPSFSLCPASGSVVKTTPVEGPYTAPTERPAAWIVDDACDAVAPTTVGTVTNWGPKETVTVTLEPTKAVVPGAGVVETTSPAGTVVE